jgi:hypothetical protein
MFIKIYVKRILRGKSAHLVYRWLRNWRLGSVPRKGISSSLRHDVQASWRNCQATYLVDTECLTPEQLEPASHLYESQGYKWAELYLHFPLRLCGAVIRNGDTIFRIFSVRRLWVFEVDLSDRFTLGLLVDTEDEDYIFLRNVCWFSADYTALYPRRECYVVPPRVEACYTPWWHSWIPLADSGKEKQNNQLCMELTIVNLLNKWSKMIYNLVALPLLKILPYIHPLHGKTPMWC